MFDKKVGYRLAGGLFLLGFVITGRAISVQEQKGFNDIVLEQLEIINTSPNFVKSKIFIMFTSLKSIVMNVIDKHTGNVLDFKKLKFVEIDKYVRNITLPYNFISFTISPFYDHFMDAEEQGKIHKVFLLA